MKSRDCNSHIVVIAGASDRRTSLLSLVRAANPSGTSSGLVSVEPLFDLPADIAVVDVDSPRVAVGAVRAVLERAERTAFIALADNPESAWVREALRAGVNAILSREVDIEEMKLAIQAADAGLMLLHPSSIPRANWEKDLVKMGREGRQGAGEIVEALTAREHEVLRLASEGLGNKEIGARLNISDHTVKFHISSILSKLGAGSRTEAVSQGIRKGLIAI